MSYRNAILEEAARACEEKEKGFLSTGYASAAHLNSSIMKRFACRVCAGAIREMKTQEEGGDAENA